MLWVVSADRKSSADSYGCKDFRTDSIKRLVLSAVAPTLVQISAEGVEHHGAGTTKVDVAVKIRALVSADVCKVCPWYQGTEGVSCNDWQACHSHQPLVAFLPLQHHTLPVPSALNLRDAMQGRIGQQDHPTNASVSRRAAQTGRSVLVRSLEVTLRYAYTRQL